MTSYFTDIISELDSLQWDNFEQSFSRIALLLRKVNDQRLLIRKEFEAITNEELERRIALSHETSTHYKWFVYKNSIHGYSIWIHEYKQLSARRFGYAEIPHNHRYWFSSLVLRGGFDHYIFSVIPPECIDTFQAIEIDSKQSRTDGTVYTVDPTTIHSISNIEDPTITLIIRSKGIKPFSSSFDPASKQVTHYYPFSSRISNFKRIMNSI